MPHRLVNARLASHAGIRQVEAVQRADAAAAAADRALGGVWQDLLGVLRVRHGYHADYERALTVLRRLPHVALGTLHSRLADLARWGHTSAAKTLTRELPLGYLQAAALGRRRLHLHESRELQEARPGLLSLFLDPSTLIDLRTTDEAAPLRTEPPALDPADLRRLFAELLFPAPSEPEIARTLEHVLPSRDWLQTGIGDRERRQAEDLAQQIASGMSQGQSQREVAKNLLPYVDGSRVRARRAARTFGLYVAQHEQERAQDQVADLSLGVQVHATLDQWTRPLHRARNGTIYYRHPGPGQLGMDQAPHPPKEADGSISFNCRCYTSVVLQAPSHIAGDPARLAVFEAGAGQIVHDPLVYTEWFAAASEPQRKLAVGARKYAALAAAHGGRAHEVAWEHFVYHETGQPLTLAELQAESAVQREERAAKVRAVIGQRRELLRQARTFGFVGA